MSFALKQTALHCMAETRNMAQRVNAFGSKSAVPRSREERPNYTLYRYVAGIGPAHVFAASLPAPRGCRQWSPIPSGLVEVCNVDPPSYCDSLLSNM